jgi:uncharacterized protein (DUF1330 family)
MIASLEPTEAQLAAFAAADQTQPIAMLNLLKFRDKAEYTDGRDAKGLSGRDAYGLYGMVAMQKIAEAGGRLFWGAPETATVIGGAEDEWDMVVIIRYPNRAAFLKMIALPDYLAAIPHRDAGLIRTAVLDCPGNAIPA